MKDSGRYHLPPEHAAALADESSPAYLPGFFQSALGALIDSPRITEAAKTGKGVGWHEHSQGVFDGAGRFFGANYSATWSPSGCAVYEARP